MSDTREESEVAAYYTADELHQQAGGMTASAARESFTKSAQEASGTYDVFLSHSVQDAVAIAGLRNLLRSQGLRIYIDWIDDPQLDRSRVSAGTARRLRERMQNSGSLMYATSRAAKSSKWMPWELGYFDGLKGVNRVSICPIETGDSGTFVGQEYLGLYKVIEKVRSGQSLHPYAVLPSGTQAQTLRSFASGSSAYVELLRR
jgi:hypothetical protein